MDKNSDNIQLNVVGYIRKSSEDAKSGEAQRQLNSFQYQRRIIDAIVERENLNLVREPFQDDYTGYKAYVRGGFQKLLDFIRNRKEQINGIVCSEISRLARNFGDGGQILWFLQDGLITRIFTHDKIFTDSSSDQLMVAINFALAKHSSDETRFRSQAAAEAKIETQRQPPKKPILGYNSEGKVGQKKWILDPKKASLVRKVFEEFATGKYTVESITDYAYSIGLRSEGNKTKTGKLSKNTVRSRLTDIQYTGVFLYCGQKHGGDYPPIISSELYYQLQRIFESRRHPQTNKHREYAYSGIIKCNDCGRLLSGTHKKGNTYYRCDKRAEPCKNQTKSYINEKELETDLIEAFESLEVDEKRWQLLREYAFEMSEKDMGEYARLAGEYASQILDEEEHKKSYAKSLVEGGIQKDMYDKLIDDSNEHIKVLRENQIKCENYAEDLRSLMFGFLDNVKLVTKRFKVASPDNKREMVDIFCENSRWDGERLRWEWKKPYFYLAIPKKSSGWLPLWEAIRIIIDPAREVS